MKKSKQNQRPYQQEEQAVLIAQASADPQQMQQAHQQLDQAQQQLQQVQNQTESSATPQQQ